MDCIKFTCPVCGYPYLNEPPRSPGGGGSLEICPCCWFEFGFDDDDRGFTYEQWRERWISEGKPWKSPSRRPPPNWDADEQLRRLLDNLNP